MTQKPLLGASGYPSGHHRIVWIFAPSRMDSRTLLKILVGLNVALAVYLVFSMTPSRPPSMTMQPYRQAAITPCVVIMNSSNSNIIVKDGRSSIGKNIQQPVQQPLPSESSLLKNPVAPDQEEGPPLFGDVKESPLNEPDDDSKSMPQSPWWTVETRSSYSVINNYVIADEDVSNDSVTLTTQGSYDFLNHAVKLCQRWEGHISLAVYAPGDDLKTSLEMIYFFRKCRDPCVRSRISWHVIYDSLHGPNLTSIPFPDVLVSDYRSLSCNTSDDDAISFFVTSNKEGLSFREMNHLPYPINVVRNVARLQARTKYLLASDIELYPSLNIVSMFKEFMKREESGSISAITPTVPHVYHLPIFEVKAGLNPPETKTELVDMFKRGDAIFFHKWVCDICQNFPDRNLWMETTMNPDQLNVFRVTKRTRQQNSWEPLYIGTNAEPLYDERLTWEGKRDKMSQMYEMCLMDYDVLVLDNAFLCHAPGIKYIDKEDNEKRLPFIKRNNAVYQIILSKLRKQYSKGPQHC